MEVLEAMVIEYECALLNALSPAQFAIVQDLQRATQLLTVARCATTDQHTADRDWTRVLAAAPVA